MTNPTEQGNAPPRSTPPRVSGGMMRVSILTELPSLLREMGQDPARLLGEQGLDPVLLADPENVLPFRVVGNLLSHCVTCTGCPHFGLLLGQRGGTATLGMVGLLAKSSPDVGSALHNLIKHLHHHDQGAVPNLSVKGNTALLGYAIYETEVLASDQIYAASMAIAFRIMRELCGSGWRPSEVWLPFRKPRDAAPFRQFFRTPLRFDAEHGALVFPVAWLNHPLQSADHEVRHQVETLLEAHEQSALTIRARRAVRTMLADGQLSADHLAGHFGVSRRTLIRQLQQEGISFHVLLKEIRLEVACQMLRDSDNLIEHIATTLGYAGASPFTRAFKTWTGQTPADWRNRNRAGPVSR
jgi:AraC-like DNA-binding protein